MVLPPQQLEAGGREGELQGGGGEEEQAGGGQAAVVERTLLVHLSLRYELGRRTSATT